VTAIQSIYLPPWRRSTPTTGASGGRLAQTSSLYGVFDLTVIGVEPLSIAWSLELSAPVKAALPAVMQAVPRELAAGSNAQTGATRRGSPDGDREPRASHGAQRRRA